MLLSEVALVLLPLLMVLVVSVLVLRLGGSEPNDEEAVAGDSSETQASSRLPTAREMREARRLQRESRTPGDAAATGDEDAPEAPGGSQDKKGKKKKSANREAKRELREYRDGAHSYTLSFANRLQFWL